MVHYTMSDLNAGKHSSQFVVINSRLILNIFVETALFVTRYSRITVVNHGESKNSKQKREVELL